MEKTGIGSYIWPVVWEILGRGTDIAALCRKLAVRRLYVFGSTRYGASLLEVADLDFLVEFLPMAPVDYADSYLWLARELTGLLGTRVNLVDTGMLDNPCFKEAVNRSKVAIYEAS